MNATEYVSIVTHHCSRCPCHRHYSAGCTSFVGNSHKSTNKKCAFDAYTVYAALPAPIPAKMVRICLNNECQIPKCVFLLFFYLSLFVVLFLYCVKIKINECMCKMGTLVGPISMPGPYTDTIPYTYSDMLCMCPCPCIFTIFDARTRTRN